MKSTSKISNSRRCRVRASFVAVSATQAATIIKLNWAALVPMSGWDRLPDYQLAFLNGRSNRWPVASR